MKMYVEKQKNKPKVMVVMNYEKKQIVFKNLRYLKNYMTAVLMI